MRDVVWTDEARKEFPGALRYLAPRSPAAAYALRSTKAGERIVILGVIHTSRDWTPDKWPDSD